MPLLNFNQRKKILENISGISKVVVQNEWDYSKNIIKIKPNYMVHGDDWKFGKDKNLRKKTIQTLKNIGAKLIEIPYTKNISSFSMQERIYSDGLTLSGRQLILKRLLQIKNMTRFLETHSHCQQLLLKRSIILIIKEKN